MSHNSEIYLEFEEEDHFPHTHNFTALNKIIIKEPNTDEIESKKKEQEILKAIGKYDILFEGMTKLMYAAALNGENLDEVYKELKNWDHLI
jgi:hypothetical protein